MKAKNLQFGKILKKVQKIKDVILGSETFLSELVKETSHDEFRVGGALMSVRCSFSTVEGILKQIVMISNNLPQEEVPKNKSHKKSSSKKRKLEDLAGKKPKSPKVDKESSTQKNDEEELEVDQNSKSAIQKDERKESEETNSFERKNIEEKEENSTEEEEVKEKKEEEKEKEQKEKEQKEEKVIEEEKKIESRPEEKNEELEIIEEEKIEKQLSLLPFKRPKAMIDRYESMAKKLGCDLKTLLNQPNFFSIQKNFFTKGPVQITKDNLECLDIYEKAWKEDNTAFLESARNGTFKLK